MLSAVRLLAPDDRDPAETARPAASASMSVSMRLRNSGQVHRTVPHRQQDTTASVPIRSVTSTSPAPHARHLIIAEDDPDVIVMLEAPVLRSQRRPDRMNDRG
jgi:hypothetical protein